MKLTSSFWEHASPITVLLICTLVTAVIGFFYYLIGPEVSLAIFYVAPVAIAAWYGNRVVGLVISLLAAISWTIAGGAGGKEYAPGWIAIWNSLVRFGFLLIISCLISSFRGTAERTAKLAFVDELTGLENRRRFFENAQEEMARSNRYGHPFTVAYVDIDDFKLINDTMGHLTGDDVLKVSAATMKANCRATDVVARLGGDEFAILLPETEENGSDELMKKILQQLQKSMQHKGWKITFSAGVITFEQPPESVRQMIRVTDDLMYTVKKSGKNGWRHQTFPCHAIEC